MRSVVSPALSIFVAGFIAAACAAGPTVQADPAIDSWPIGAEVGCAGPVTDGTFVPMLTPEASETDADLKVLGNCTEMVLEALRGLDARDPGHAAVRSVAIHREGTMIDPATGKMIIWARSGACCSVLVAELADGSRSAIGVGYPGISTEPIAVEWEIGGEPLAP
jgi:hypothetical protein